MPHIKLNDKISLFYEEYGTGPLDADNIILSAQVGFYPKGMQQHLATLGFHVFCITLRGFHPSTLVEEDFGEHWYDVLQTTLPHLQIKWELRVLSIWELLTELEQAGILCCVTRTV